MKVAWYTRYRGDCMKSEKTNAMRFLDKENIIYEYHTYEHGKDAVDGITVATLLNEDPEKVFKTLVCISNQKNYYVFVIPVKEELDLKKCAKVVHEKNVEMIPVKDITKITGYVRGGCSLISMKKQFRTVIHESCILQETIIFSGGRIGLQIEMDPEKLIPLLHLDVQDIIK